MSQQKEKICTQTQVVLREAILNKDTIFFDDELVKRQNLNYYNFQGSFTAIYRATTNNTYL